MQSNAYSRATIEHEVELRGAKSQNVPREI
jgi:hypothetical protein